jgi:hypothetical protein
MNQYLFLFPIQKYVDACLEKGCGFVRNGHRVSELTDVIDARYRVNDYEINWLFFSDNDDSSKPDLSCIANGIVIPPEDRKLVAGVSFERHVNKKIYADCNFVLDQLPFHRRLVLGGFHQFDCVDKVAKVSYERGIDTFVDEDTTELFFAGRVFYRIPLVRIVWTLEELGLKGVLKEIAKENRASRPWFVQE